MSLKDKLQAIYLDEEGSPKKIAFISSFMITILLIFAVMYISGDKVKKTSEGVQGLIFDVPPEKKESSVELNDTSKYVTKEELERIINRNPNQDESLTPEQLQKILEQQQKNIILQMRKEREEEIESLQSRKSNEQGNGQDSNQSQGVGQSLTEDKKTYQSEFQTSKDQSKSNFTGNSDNSNNRENGSFNNNNSFNSYPGDYSSKASNNSSNQVRNNVQGYGGSVAISDNESGGSVLINNSVTEEEPGYEVKLGVPAGKLIPSILKTGLVSSKEKATAIVDVTEDIKYKGEVLIPKGATFYGSARADYGVRQIFVTLEKLIIGDREIKMKATLVKADGTPGFCSKYIDLRKREHWYTALAQFTSGVFNAFKDKTIIPSNDENPTPQIYYDQNLKNAMINGVDQGVEGWTEALAADAREQEAIILVYPEIKTNVLIQEKITLDKFKSR
jgi:hypothetical protein